MNDDELESIEKLHLSSAQGVTTVGLLSGVSSGTITHLELTNNSGNQILTANSSGIGWSTAASGNNTEMELDMKDFVELVQTSEFRGELLLDFGKMVIAKLESMPNNGGLNIKTPLLAAMYPNYIGNGFACALANAWGYPIASVIQSRVFRNGDFKFKVII